MLIAAERSFLAGNENAYQSLPLDAMGAAITLAELWIGVNLADTPARREARQAELERIRGRFEVLAFGEREAEVHGRLFADLRKAGQLIGERDLQIAATAFANSHELMTSNTREFERVPGLVLRAP